ncbi:MAG: PorV/PorQ family protein [candidate division WOR-3 bacterium]
MVNKILNLKFQTPNKSQIPNSVSLLTFYFLLSTFIFAQDGGLPGAVLNYGMSPRTTAMGKAFTGLADDAEAIYYNPAGLAQLYSHNMKSSYLELYGHQLGYLGYALPTRRYGTFGGNIIHLRSKGIDSRDENMNPYGTYYFSQSCLLLSYAYLASNALSIGTNLKFFTSKIAQYGSVGIGGDAGIFLFPRHNYTFGVSVQNILGPKLQYLDDGETEEFPVTFRFGGAIKLYQGRAVIVGDLVKNLLEYSSVKPHLGFEFTPVYPILIIRAGFDENTLNAGLGVRKFFGTMSVGVDYAIEFHHKSSYLLPYQHKIGIFIEFGGFRTWVTATPKQFSPAPGRKENVAWLDLHYTTKREIERWQLLIKNQYGEVVRTYSGWDAPPLRLSWDGLDDVGRLVADGRYYYEIIIIDKGKERITFSDYLVKIATLGPQGEIEFVPQE